MDQVNPKLFDELLKVTDATVRLWDETEVSSAAAHLVYTRACAVFRALSEDNDFKKFLHVTVSEEGKTHDEEAAKILHDLDTFVHFLKVEKSILVEAGLSARTADVLLHHLTVFRKKMSPSEARMHCTFESLSTELDRTAAEICTVADEIGRTAARNKRWVLVRRLGLQAGGWAIIGANGASFVAEVIATSGLTLPVGGVSLASAVGGRTLLAVAKEV
jgi:hypothetical protein